ncbi:hypothetical protein HW532_08190 [Kaustia mangrovi]|uniref:Uncharacterized protein n=1 Tax=Kaustia mangrovi TaxID=2593653 RepID=A0A7S8C3H3_9HYPH|nr:hypothetical protein [Kaustia mangrovi]QPC42681.1 hypothetical protein HW532_08190 [Kaustia mangrovi]
MKPLRPVLHELANSLQAADCYLEVLRHELRNSDNPADRAYLEAIVRQVRAAKQGLHRLRDRIDRDDAEIVDRPDDAGDDMALLRPRKGHGGS